MPPVTQQLTELLCAPMEEVIISLGTSVAKAQQELDRHSLQTQKEIETDAELSEAGVAATFYQIPSVELELTMAVTMTPPPVATASSASAAKVLKPLKMQLQPVNAYYTNQFGFEVNASSKLKLTIVPVPAPGSTAA